MTLRETKARRTRALLIDTALDEFVRAGYEATTMEHLAEIAQVGTTTLYRYFPMKDLLLLDPLVRVFDLAPRVRERPSDEPIAQSLGAALRAVAMDVDDTALRIAEIRRIVDDAPVPRARLWDRFARIRVDLEEVLSERGSGDDLSVRLTAGVAVDLLQAIGHDPEDATEAMTRVLRQLPRAQITLPVLSVAPDQETTVDLNSAAHPAKTSA